MTRIGANDAHHALAANDAAIFANATNGTANFHDESLLLPVSKRAHIKPYPAEKSKGVFKSFLRLQKLTRNHLLKSIAVSIFT